VTDRPNVLVFMTDQQRSVTIDGDHRLRAVTPNLDAFRVDATVFAHGYAPSPHCCPSRASFFTGLHPSEHGVWNNVNVPNALSRGPREGTAFWSSDLEAAGYRMAFTGKWHVDNRQGPGAYGWQELGPKPWWRGESISADEQRAAAVSAQLAGLRSAVPSGTDADVAEGRNDGEIIRPGWPAWSLYGTMENPFGDDDVVAAGVRYLEEAAAEDAPFALYVGTLGPHDPYIPPRRFLDLYDPESIELPDSFDDDLAGRPAMYSRIRDRFDQLTREEHRRALHHYLAFCSYQDELFGRLLDTLHKSGLYEDTIVLYLSDHGDYTGEHGLWAKGLPSFLPAYQVPIVIKDANRDATAAATRQVRRSELSVSLVDLGPTLLDLCGVQPGSPMSGESVADELVAPSHRQRDLFMQSNGNEVYGIQRIVLTNRWKLVVNLFDDDELYDRHADPDEMINLIGRAAPSGRVLGRPATDLVADAFRPIVQDLYDRLWRFGLDHNDDIFNPYILTALATFGPLGQLRGG